MNRDEFITSLILLGFAEVNSNIPRVYVYAYTHAKKALHIKIDRQHNTVRLWDIAALNYLGPLKDNGLSNNYQEALKNLVPYMDKADG